MKKLKLDLQSIKGIEILTREQLKSIGGGDENEGEYCGPIRCKVDEYCVIESGGSGFPFKCEKPIKPLQPCSTNEECQSGICYEGGCLA